MMPIQALIDTIGSKLTGISSAHWPLCWSLAGSQVMPKKAQSLLALIGEPSPK